MTTTEATKDEAEYDEVGEIIAYEQGRLDDERTLRLFSRLVASGQAWTLQGHYGRTARDLIESGLIERGTGKVQWERYSELQAEIEDAGGL